MAAPAERVAQLPPSPRGEPAVPQPPQLPVAARVAEVARRGKPFIEIHDTAVNLRALLSVRKDGDLRNACNVIELVFVGGVKQVFRYQNENPESNKQLRDHDYQRILAAWEAADL